MNMAKKITTKKKTTNRPKPSSPRSGFRVDGRRYDCGGKIKTGK